MFAIVASGMIYGLYKVKKTAENKANKLNWEYGMIKYSVQTLNSGPVKPIEVK